MPLSSPVCCPHLIPKGPLPVPPAIPCRQLGCPDAHCQLCEQNPLRHCPPAFCSKYFVGDALKAACGAGIRCVLSLCCLGAGKAASHVLTAALPSSATCAEWSLWTLQRARWWLAISHCCCRCASYSFSQPTCIATLLNPPLNPPALLQFRCSGERDQRQRAQALGEERCSSD